MSRPNVWIVGQINDDGWSFVGAFTSEARAIAACTGPDFFVGPATLDERAPDEDVPWPGAFVPAVES